MQTVYDCDASSLHVPCSLTQKFTMICASRYSGLCASPPAIGSAYIPSALTGSPFFHAAPSAPPCISRNPQAPALAALTHRLGAPILAQKPTNIRNYIGANGNCQQDQQQPERSTFTPKEPVLCWPPPGSVSVGFGNIRNEMAAAASEFSLDNSCMLPPADPKQLSVISVPDPRGAPKPLILKPS